MYTEWLQEQFLRADGLRALSGLFSNLDLTITEKALVILSHLVEYSNHTPLYLSINCCGKSTNTYFNIKHRGHMCDCGRDGFPVTTCVAAAREAETSHPQVVPTDTIFPCVGQS